MQKYFDGVFDKADSDAIKELYQAGKKDEAKAKVTETIGKLADNIKPVAEKVQGVCMKIYEEAGHKHAKRVSHRDCCRKYSEGVCSTLLIALDVME